MKKLLAILLLIPSLSFAFDIGSVETVGVHTLTRHDPSYGANDFNLGFYAQTDKGYIAGGYFNSIRKMSYYAGWTSPEWNRLNVSFVGVTGYFKPVTFVAVPSVRLHTFENGPSIFISGSPVKITEDGQAVLHISASWSLK